MRPPNRRAGPVDYYQKDTNNFGPRFGFAYRPFSGNKTVMRGGWGVYYNFIPGFIGNHENIFNPPWRSGSSFSSQLPGTPTQPFLPDLTFNNPFPTNAQSGPACESPDLHDPTQSGEYRDATVEFHAGAAACFGLGSSSIVCRSANPPRFVVCGRYQ